MRRLALATLLLVSGFAARADAAASLQLDRQRIAVGETAELSVTVDDAQDVPAPSVPVPEGLRIDYRGQSTSVSIVNGRMSATASHTYAVTAERAGAYAIGPVRIEQQGRTLDAGSIRLLVVAGQAGPADGGDALRLVARASSERVYLYEPLTLTLRLEVRGVRVSDLQYPNVTADGLTVGGFPEPAQRRERGPNGPVDVVEFTTEVVPVRSGTLALGPSSMQMSVVVAGRADPFFGSMFGRRQARTLVAPPIEIEVVPLPAEGRPPGFSGAVGRFALAVDAKPTELDQGDPVTLAVTVSGTGTLAQAAAPAVPPTPGLKTYDPSEPTPASRNGDVVTRRFEQVVIPEQAGAITIPAIEFSYFDPSAARYATVRGSDVALVVRPRATATPDVVVGAPAPTARAEQAEQLGRDIVFIKDDPGRMVPVGSAPWRSATFWLLQLVPLVVLGAVAWWDRRRARLGADPRLARFAAAGAAARRALAEAKRADAPDAVARAVVEYLGAKLDLAPGAVTTEAVRTRLERAGVAASVVDDAAALLDACEHERYRPAGSAGGAASLLARAQRVVAALERERRIVLPVAVLLLLAVAGAAVAATAPNTLFFRGNALYAEGRFDDAAAAWEEILAAGLESGPLHYNLGNARLRAGDRGRAVLAYERAWRLMPGDADLMANLRFAKEDADPTEGMSLAGRIAFPLAERAPTARLVRWAVSAYWLLVAALVVARLAPVAGRAARVTAALGGVALLLAASAACYRHALIDAPDWAVALADATVRFEPAEAGTAHYEAPLGTVVEILAEREGWAQVARRADGLRGWVERGALAPLRARAS